MTEWRCSIRCPDWRFAEKLAASYVRKGSLYLQTQRALDIDARIEITIHLPGVDDLVVHGTVQGVLEGDSRESGVIVKLESRHDIDMMLLEEMAVAGGVESTTGESAAEVAEPPAALRFRASTLPASTRRRTLIPMGAIANVVGIDFGTTNTRLAVAIGERMVLVPDARGRTLHPSVVHFPAKGGPVAGWDAEEFLFVDPERTVASSKRLLGRRYDDPAVAGWLQNVAFRTTRGPDESVVLDIGGEPYAVAQACAAILSHARALAEQQLAMPIHRAVLTVPVGFSEAQRKALSRAGHIAGLEVVALVEEPIAAALAYGLGKGRNEVVATYDFGGGTFDFTVLDLSGESFRVLAVGGDAWLGGDDFDLALAQFVADSFWQWSTIDLRKRAVEWQRLVSACEEAKKKLSTDPSAVVAVPGITEAHDLSQQIEQSQVEGLCRGLFERSLVICRETLARAGLEPREVTQVVASGGIARVPFVRKGLAQFFDREILTLVDPDEAICVGAGLFAARLEDHPLKALT